MVPKEQRTVEYVKTKIKEVNLTNSESKKKNSVSTFTIFTIRFWGR